MIKIGLAFPSLISPLLGRELRIFMRSAKSFFCLLFFLLALLYLVSENWTRFADSWAPRGDIARGARTLFYSFANGHLSFLIVLAPFLFAPSIVEERENSTLELLISSPISLVHIVLAKLLSPLIYVLLLLTAALPVLSLCFLGGGLAVDEVVRTYLILLCASVNFSCLVLFCSTLRSRVYEVYLLSIGITFFYSFILPFHGTAWKYLSTLKWEDMGSLNHGFQFLSPYYVLMEEIFPSILYRGKSSWIPDPFLSITSGSLQYLGYAQGNYLILSLGASALFLLAAVKRLTSISQGLSAKGEATAASLTEANPLRISRRRREQEFQFHLTSQEGNPGLVLERRVQWFARVLVVFRMFYSALMISIILLPLASFEGSWLFLSLPFFIAALFTLPLSATSISSDRERGTLDLLRTSLLSNRQIVYAKFVTNLQYNFYIALALYLPGMLLQIFFYWLGFSMDLMKDFYDLTALLMYPLLLFCALVMYTMIGLFCSAYFRRTNRALIVSGTIIVLSMMTPFVLPTIITASRLPGIVFGMLGLLFISPLSGISMMYPQGHTNLLLNIGVTGSVYFGYWFAGAQSLFFLLLTYGVGKSTVRILGEMD